MTLFNFNYLLKTLAPNVVTLGVRALTYEFRWYTIQSMSWISYLDLTFISLTDSVIEGPMGFELGDRDSNTMFLIYFDLEQI